MTFFDLPHFLELERSSLHERVVQPVEVLMFSGQILLLGEFLTTCIMPFGLLHHMLDKSTAIKSTLTALVFKKFSHYLLQQIHKHIFVQ
jgi:hypothetical protein